MYLGITFDRRLNFNEHVRNVRKKTARIAHKIVNLIRIEYGKNMTFLRKVMNRVVAPAILYGSEIWGSKAG